MIIFHNFSENDFEFPVDKNRFQMVSSPDKKALYAIGGANGYNDNTNDIYKFHCSGTISTCKWTKSETTLRIGRSSFVAIPIPNVLADKLCSTDQTTLVPTNPTTAGPINPTTTTDSTMEGLSKWIIHVSFKSQDFFFFRV